MSAATVIILRRKRLIRRFREAQATDARHAVSLESLGQRDGWIFRQMLRHGVFVSADDGRYYLVEPAAETFMRSRRIRAFVIVGILLVAWLLLSLLAKMVKGF